MEAAKHPASDMLAGPGGAQTLAFEAQEGDLVHRIDRPQPRVELQAVDDLHRIAQKDVLGPQIAMPVNDPLRANARLQQPRPAAQELAQHGVNMPDEAGRATQTGIEQYPPIVCHRAVPVREIAHRLQCDRNSPPVELQESRREAVELPSRDAT